VSCGLGCRISEIAQPVRAVVVPAALVDRRRFVEDLQLLHQFGVEQVRIGIDWAWMQPKPGEMHGAAVEFYLGAAQTARDIGVGLQFTLLQRAVPVWFDNEGGFTDARFARHWWPRWVEGCAEMFGDVVAGWVPIDHPLGVANALEPDDPRRHGEVLDTLVVAWRDAWRILRGGPPVSTAFGVEVVRPVDQTLQAAEAARRFDQIRWRLWLDGLRTGNVSIPGRADRELADLAGACDVVGIVVRHEHDVLGLLHRTAEQAPERPLAVTLLLPTGADAGREAAVERYLAGATEAATGLPLATMAVSPSFDANELADPAQAQGIITRDRELKDSGRRFLGLET
jgi:beta-glucosidase